MVRKWKWYLLTKGTLESLTHPFKEATQELSLHSPTRTQVTPRGEVGEWLWRPLRRLPPHPEAGRSRAGEATV